jgi:hypothetical protein
MNVPIPNVYHPAGTLVNDGSTIVTPSNSNVVLGQLNNNPYNNPYNNPFKPFNDPWEDPIKAIEERLKKLETENKFLRLKILSIEGKFTQEEVANIRKMLISEDESSRTLAESIIDNA